MESGLLIGEVAARSGLSHKALRLYEARGILPPSRRTAAGYRRYPADVLRVLAFVAQARRVGLTLLEISHIVALRRAGSSPCVHVRALLEQKAVDLESLLTDVRGILAAWQADNGNDAAVCPHIERGGQIRWIGKSFPSARTASTARKSSSTAIPSASARTRTSSSSRRRNGTS